MQNIISQMQKDKKIDLEDIVIKKLDDVEILILSAHIYSENISIVRQSYEYESEIIQLKKDNSMYDYLLSIKNEKYTGLYYEAIVQTIKNVKVNTSIKELISESFLYAANFENEYYDKLEKKYDKDGIYEIFRIFLTIKQLIYQKNCYEDEFEKNHTLLLYLTLQDKINSNIELTEEQKEQYENLKFEYGDFEYDIDSDINEIIEEYKNYKDYCNNTYLIDYIEENTLLDFFEDKKYDKKIFDRVLSKLTNMEYQNEARKFN